MSTTPLPNVPMQPDHADLEFLSKIAGERDGMIMLPPITLHPQELQQALYRAIVGDWIRLVDMQMGQLTLQAQPVPMRIFKITDAGRARLSELRVSVTM